jgi:hypothetical protein
MKVIIMILLGSSLSFAGKMHLKHGHYITVEGPVLMVSTHGKMIRIEADGKHGGCDITEEAAKRSGMSLGQIVTSLQLGADLTCNVTDLNVSIISCDSINLQAVVIK